jgi:RNA polymerase sigma-70 factor (ECF subfamily)
VASSRGEATQAPTKIIPARAIPGRPETRTLFRIDLPGRHIRRERDQLNMGPMMVEDSSETHRLLERTAEGDQESWGTLLIRHENRLRRMVALRMDQRLQGRIDPQDVIQDAYVEASEHRAEYLQQPAVPFFLWLRGIVGNKLRELHRHHLGTRMRDAHREVALYRGNMPAATSAALAAQLLGHATSPSQAAIRVEGKIHLQEALNSMDPFDREALVLRHFEQLSPAEAAQVLGIKEKAAGMRYLRALKRLKDILNSLPGGLEELRR